jgi:3-(3-hydroxy-phenyl)propionate hydroxylase
MQKLETQVVIVGAGPCGVTIANFLGLYGIDTILLDRVTDILDYPRAVGIDDESMRVYQALGLADEISADMIRNQALRYFDAKGRYLAQVRPQQEPFGWPRRFVFLQPMMEASIRRGLSRFPKVKTLFGHEMTGLVQDERKVETQVTTDTGETLTIVSDYVVGADGGRSTVRRLIGTELVGSTAASRWLVIDVEKDTLDAPYSGSYVDVHRPRMCINLPYGQRRFEFRMTADETEEEILKPDNIDRLLRPLYGNNPMPQIKRARVYQHHSRVAERFQTGRVFLAGDAAHLQPPFFGQGMNSGLRDAANISWKLAAVLSGRARDKILETYDAERRGHAAAMVKFATFMGGLYSPSNQFTAILRRWVMQAIQHLPSLRDYILQMRFKPLPFYERGLVLHEAGAGKSSPVGRMLMQPRVETKDKKHMRLDDAVGGWFALIGLDFDPAERMDAAQIAAWQDMGGTIVRINKSRSAPECWQSHPATIVLDDLDGAFRDWRLQSPQWDVIMLRPDRYVAAVGNRSELTSMLEKLKAIM